VIVVLLAVVGVVAAITLGIVVSRTSSAPGLQTRAGCPDGTASGKGVDSDVAASHPQPVPVRHPDQIAQLLRKAETSRYRPLFEFLVKRGYVAAKP
jgi:hypothetical protein